MTVKVHNSFDVLEDKGEVISQETKTDTAGYVSAEVQIREMLQAGINLKNYRREHYGAVTDDDDEIDNLEPDPTASGNFDPVDAQQYVESLAAKMQSSNPAPQPPEVPPVAEGDPVSPPVA